MKPVAILDFGTNTFNLLIAQDEGKSFKRIYSGKEAVKLGRGGINKRMITDEAMERGFKAISNHMDIIKSYGAEEIHAYATSAMRNAENGNAFAEEIERRFSFHVNIIPGEQEAELIYKGITESVDLGAETGLILDIGGGSNEFIICDRHKMHWKHSFELGMARILEQFTISDPITKEEIANIEKYYKAELGLLFENVRKFKPTVLIGASGSFDTIAAMLIHKLQLSGNGRTSLNILPEDYRVIHHILLNSTISERKNMPGMEPVRIEMIVPATIFINFVMVSCGLKQMYQSDYALKEGVMATLIES